MAIKSADQITIYDVTDAYSVNLSSEAYTFAGNVSGAVASSTTCTTVLYIVQAGTTITPSSITASTLTNCTTTVGTLAAAGTTITFTVASGFTGGEITLTIVADGVTWYKKFSMAVAATGATGATGAQGAQGIQGETGVGVESSAVTYQVSSSATSAPTGTWSSTVPTTSTGQYLWTKTVITYSDDSTTTLYSVAAHGATGATGAAGAQGVQGETGNGIESTTITYQVGTSATTAPTGTWSSSIQATSTEGEYLWVKTVIAYTDGDDATFYSVSAHGSDGADAITLAITSSNGTVFKNSSGSTTLTAHVYVGGVEVDADDYGTVKWYVGSSTTAAATGTTYTVSASDVDSTLAITAQLE